MVAARYRWTWLNRFIPDAQFQEHWIKKGIEGGKAAAYALRSAIYEQCGSRADDVEVVARVVANLGGLSRAMQRDGCIDNASELKDFTLGFTQAKASFDFVDVGYGKERADSKIKGSAPPPNVDQRAHVPDLCCSPFTNST